MTIQYSHEGVLEQGDIQKRWFPKDGVRRVSTVNPSRFVWFEGIE